MPPPVTLAESAKLSKGERTLARLVEVGLELFERKGYGKTTTAEIARAAGLSEMTFFRYFSAKEHLLLQDPYDPFLIAGIAAEPLHMPPFLRAVRGLRTAWRALPEPEAPSVRSRIRIVARTPELRGAMWHSMGKTENAIIQQLVADGAPSHVARVAAASVLGALVAGLFVWAENEEYGLAFAIESALDVIEVNA